MSDLLEAAKQNLPGVPDELVMRAASARAAAAGTSVDDVLASWGGGGSLPSSGGAAPAEAPAEPAAEAPATTAEAPVPAAVAAPASAAVAAPAAVATREVVYVLPGEDAEPVEPLPLGQRVRTGLLLGGGLGTVAGIAAAMATFAWTGGQSAVIESGPALLVDSTVEIVLIPGQFSFTMDRAMAFLGGIFAVAGFLIARVAAALPGRFYPDHAVEYRGGVIGTFGLLLGAALGAGTGAFITAGGEEVLGQEGLVAIPAMRAWLWTVVLAVVMGAIVAVVAQIITLPAGVDTGPDAEAEVVRRRLATGYVVPVVILVTLAAIIVGIGTIFLAFPGQAWIIAIVVAGSILAFGFLATARPDMEITRTDVAVAFTGIAIVVIFLAAAAYAVVGTHGGEEGEEEPAVEADAEALGIEY